MNTPRNRQLMRYANTHRQGFTTADIERDLGWTPPQFHGAVRVLRGSLAGLPVELVSEPQGQGEPWRFRLVGGLDLAAVENDQAPDEEPHEWDR
jgi:hypothetical protein